MIRPMTLKMFALPDATRELDQALRGATHDGRLTRLHALAGNIHEVEPNPTSPTREILVRLGDRWSSLLLSVLDTGHYRHTELHRVVNVMSRLASDSTVSQRMLTLRLRVLERDGLIRRSVGTGNAPAVEYGLTPLGSALAEKLRALIDWSTEHADTIRQAQAAFDARETLPTDRLRHRMR
jgi:DNA-binding HxlR family transcriptional regulator